MNKKVKSHSAELSIIAQRGAVNLKRRAAQALRVLLSRWIESDCGPCLSEISTSSV